MFEDIEELSFGRKIDQCNSISDTQLSYIEEVLPLNDSSILVDRIDELSNSNPPKAIDSDKNVANLINPIIDKIDVQYLEAPNDSIQIEQVSDMMVELEALNFEEWKEMSFEQRYETLQSLENKIADIAHRPACELHVQYLEDGYYGYYDNDTKDITINSRYIASDNFDDYKECLDTLVHEGRHAYQDYNMYIREVHPRGGEVTNWKTNEIKYGYQDVCHCGFEAYEMQPVECDARAFAEDVLNSYFNKTA